MAIPSALPSSNDSVNAAATRPSVIARFHGNAPDMVCCSHRVQHGRHGRQQPAVSEARGDLPGQQEHQRRNEPRRQLPAERGRLGVCLPSDRPERSRWYGTDRADEIRAADPCQQGEQLRCGTALRVAPLPRDTAAIPVPQPIQLAIIRGARQWLHDAATRHPMSPGCVRA